MSETIFSFENVGRFLNRPYTYENTAHHLVGGIVYFSRFSNVDVL